MRTTMIATGLAGVFFCGAVHAATMTMLSISDIDMRPIEWGVISKANNVSISDSRFVNTEALLVNASGPFFGVIFRKTPVWSPAALGSIESVTLSADFFIGNAGVTFAPLLVQGQNVYAPPGFPPYFIQPQNSNTPQGLSWNLPISLYGREIGTGPGVPDFSAGALPIHLGIGVRRDASGTSFLFGNVHGKLNGMVPGSAHPGDFDCDGDVDNQDYSTWKLSFGNSVTVGGGADGNRNGLIDAGDYNVWRDAFSAPSAVASVPEPASILVALASITAAARVRRGPSTAHCGCH